MYMHKLFTWDEKKNGLLKKTRNISFEEIILAINNGHLLDYIKHPNKQKYLHQKMLVVEIKKYVYVVPYVEDKKKKFLKTIFKSRLYTKKYLKK